MRRQISIQFFALMFVAGTATPAEVIPEESPGFIPYLTEPARVLPAGLKLDAYNSSGNVCGNIVLVPKKSAWNVPYAVEAAYRWENGAWQAGVPWLPTDKWPAYIRHGYLGYGRTNTGTGADAVDFLDASTGGVLWATDNWFFEPYYFDLNEHALVKRRRDGGVEIMRRNLPRLVLPIASQLH